MALRIDEDLVYQAKVRALSEGVILRDVVEQALQLFLNQHSPVDN